VAVELLMMLFMSARPAHAGWRSLSGVLPAYTDIRSVRISADSRNVVFRADVESDERYELYSVPITGSVPLKLNPPLVAGGSVDSFLITPDSSRVVYAADQDTNDLDELYSVPIASGSTVKLNPAISTSIYTFFLTPGIAYVMFIAKATGASAYELYGNDTPGATPRNRSYILAAGE